MTPDLTQAIAEFGRENGVVMLIADPRHPDALEAASFLWGSSADEFLNAEVIKAVSTKELDKVFAFVGIPFQRLLMTNSGRAAEVEQWAGEIAGWYANKRMSPAILAITQDESLKTAVGNIISASDQADRWSKFLG